MATSTSNQSGRGEADHQHDSNLDDDSTLRHLRGSILHILHQAEHHPQPRHRCRFHDPSGLRLRLRRHQPRRLHRDLRQAPRPLPAPPHRRRQGHQHPAEDRHRHDLLRRHHDRRRLGREEAARRRARQPCRELAVDERLLVGSAVRYHSDRRLLHSRRIAGTPENLYVPIIKEFFVLPIYLYV